MKHVTQSIVIDAPLDHTFDASNRVEDWPNMMDDYASIEVLQREGYKITFRLKHVNGTEWTSWRVVDREAKFALAERVDPRAPFGYMHHLWTYRALSDGRTEMTWTMAFELPEAQRHREDECARYLLEHSSVNQARMKSSIERGCAREACA
jgi:aromatase